jgi:hypothetical protein
MYPPFAVDIDVQNSPFGEKRSIDVTRNLPPGEKDPKK